MELNNTNLNPNLEGEKDKQEKDRKLHLEKLEFALKYYSKQYSKSKSKDEKIENFMEIRKIINTMYFFPELHNSEGFIFTDK